MKLKPEISLRQHAQISPRLYQRLNVLRLGANELADMIQKELIDNPALEMPEPADLTPEQDMDVKRSSEAAAELWQEASQAGSRPPARQAEGGEGSRQDAIELAASPEGLADYLTVQLDLLDLSEEERSAGLILIGSLDENGYLKDSVDEVARITGYEPALVENILAKIQDFDPAGVAARGLKECLLLQLRPRGGNKLACRIVDGFLPQVARGAYAKIARELSVTPEEVKRAVELIRSLNASPGSLFDTNPAAAIVVPDVYVRKNNDRVQILANSEVMPSLAINSGYRKMGMGEIEADREAVEYIKSMTARAKRFIRDIDERRSTIMKVARVIAEVQSDFLERGPAYLRPLTLDDVAGRLGLHPSTVSRSIVGKYMNTPWGVFEFRYFFSGGYESAGGRISATAVMQRLGRLVEGEDPKRPLSDQKITDLLKEKNISISRRTVAKYRESMGIPRSSERSKVS